MWTLVVGLPVSLTPARPNAQLHGGQNHPLPFLNHGRKHTAVPRPLRALLVRHDFTIFCTFQYEDIPWRITYSHAQAISPKPWGKALMTLPRHQHPPHQRSVVMFVEYYQLSKKRPTSY